jgi:DNA polymerase III epsilon subunit-like protein
VEKFGSGVLAVRYGLAGIRSLGVKTIDRLLALPPRTLEDLFSLDIGKRDLRALSYSGALDHLLPRGSEDREAVLGVVLPKAKPKTTKAVAKRQRQDSQLGLFAAPQKPSIVLPHREPSDDDMPLRLAAERKYTGIYLSGHPLNAFAEGRSLKARPDKRDTIMIPVLLDRVFERRTKKGEWMAILFVQDRTRCEEIPCFPKSYAKLADQLELSVGKTIMLDCGATSEGKLHAERFLPLGWKLPIIEDNGTPLSDFIVLDLETTGRDDDDRSPGTQRIVEVGISEFVGRSHSRNYSRLINPTMPISEGSRKVHGISDDMVAGAPTFSATAPRLADYLRNRVIVTYNGTRFDIPVLQAEFARAGVAMPPMVAIDLYRHVRNRYDRPIRPASKQLGDQCAFFEVNLEKAHRAADDAEATGRLLIAMQDRGLAPKGIDSLVGV